jgi:hypothetical protein
MNWIIDVYFSNLGMTQAILGYNRPSAPEWDCRNLYHDFMRHSSVLLFWAWAQIAGTRRLLEWKLGLLDIDDSFDGRLRFARPMENRRSRGSAGRRETLVHKGPLYNSAPAISTYDAAATYLNEAFSSLRCGSTLFMRWFVFWIFPCVFLICGVLFLTGDLGSVFGWGRWRLYL